MAKKLDDVALSPFIAKMTLFSSGGPFLEGYVLSVIGVALVKIEPELGIDAHGSGLIGVAALLGLFVGALAGGYLTDRIGRRKMFVLDVITIIILSVACAFVTTQWELLALRFLIGLAIGADYPIATSMIAEFTPRRYRAHSMGAIACMWYVGANAAYLVGYFLMDTPDGWRWMLASTAVPCIIILLGRWGIPESPRWLYTKGRIEEANQIVKDLFGEEVELNQDETPTKTEFRKIFQPHYLWRVIFIGVIWLCQAIPMFAIYTFGPQLTAAFNLGSGSEGLIGELAIGTFFLIGCIPAMFLAEHWGRRKLIIVCFAVMSVAMFILGIMPGVSLWIVGTCFALYALFAGGPGNLEWLYPNELFPTEIRASAMGVAMALSRTGTVVSIYILPQFLANYGIGPTMVAGAIISVLGLVVSIVWAPETAGYTLAETSAPEFNARRRKYGN